MGSAQAAIFAFQFSSSVILARYLSPTEMGVFAVGLAVIGMLALLQSFGLQPLVVREEKLTPALEATIFTINALSLVIQSAATFLLASLAGRFLGDEGVRHILVVLSCSPLFGIFSFMPGAKLERNGRFKDIALISAITSAVGSAVMVVFAVLGHSYMSLAYGQLVGAATLAAALMFVGREHQIVRFSISEWRRVSHFGFQMFAYSGIKNLSQRFCEIALGRIAGLAALGLYNRASGINNMLWGNIHSLASRVMLVDYAKHHRAGMPLRERYIQTQAVLTAILWPAFAGIAVLSEPFISLAYGEKWIAAAVPLTFLAIASIILVAITMSWELFAVTGNVATQTRLELYRTLVSVPLFIGACFFGIAAVAFTRIIDALIAFALYRPHLERMSGTTFGDALSVYLQSAALTFLAILPAGLLMVFSSNGEPHWQHLILAVLAGIALWGGALFLLDHPLKEEIYALRRKVPLRS